MTGENALQATFSGREISDATRGPESSPAGRKSISLHGVPVYRYARAGVPPELAVKLDDGRKALEAAQRGMGFVQGLATSATEWNGERLLSFTLADGGEDSARALGFGDEQIIRSRQAQQAKRLMAA